jgi:hypothetical protein
MGQWKMQFVKHAIFRVVTRTLEALRRQLICPRRRQLSTVANLGSLSLTTDLRLS